MGSIYEALKDKEKYDFYSGQEEVNYLYGSNKLSVNDKVNLCDYLLGKLINMHNDKNICPKFHLKQNVLVSYKDMIIKKIKIFLNEGLLDKEWLEGLTDFLIFQSKESWMVKLGLILSEFYKDKAKIKDIVNIFSKDGEYIFYLDKIINYIDNYNDYLFELSKKSEGNIKLFCFTNIKKYDDEKLKYLIEEGYRDEFYEYIYINFIMSKLKVLNYMTKEIGAAQIDNLSYIVSSYLKENNITSSSINYDFIKEFFKIAKGKGNTLYALYAIYLIREGVIIDGNERIKKDIDNFLNNKRWIYIFENSVLKSKGDSEAIIDLADYYDYQLTFNDFLPYLERNKEDISIYCYIVQDGSNKDKAEIIKYFYNNFNIKDFIGNPQDTDKLPDSRGDIILALVINSAKIMPDEGKTIAMLGLFGNRNEVRKESIRVLRRYRDDISDKEWEVIKSCYEKEPNKKIKILLDKLLYSDENNKKEFIKIKEKFFEEHIEDAYLVTAKVCGVNYRHRGLLEKELEESTRFYLYRDIDNEYNDNLIKIAGESGFVIGYVPKEYSVILNNMLVANKSLYGKIQDYELDEDYIKINIYESYKDVIDAINNTLQMITDKQNGNYIN